MNGKIQRKRDVCSMKQCSLDINNKAELSPEMFSQVGGISVHIKLETQRVGFHHRVFSLGKGMVLPDKAPSSKTTATVAEVRRSLERRPQRVPNQLGALPEDSLPPRHLRSYHLCREGSSRFDCFSSVTCHLREFVTKGPQRPLYGEYLR